MALRSIGFVGLGIMGGPMAANVVHAGFEVAGYNRSRGKVEPPGRGWRARCGERVGDRAGS
jgi:2-hydroxy-3-oxopropionate reductase